VDPSERLTLDRLIARLADGDRTAFAPVFALVEPLVRRFVARSVSAADVDDVVQETLLKIFARVGERDPAREALPWILGVAAWECRTVRRRVGRRREDHVVADVELAAHDTPEDNVMIAELIGAAEAALGTLGAADVATIRAALGDAPRPDVAGATFRKRAQRAFDRLRAAWRARHGS
jgi:RNA polymerase sigma-70 factor (ECF subfamily)